MRQFLIEIISVLASKISSMIKGTGKWEGFQGGGTYKKYQVIPEGIVVMEWEGEFIKK
jgi:hypothetical protein